MSDKRISIMQITKYDNPRKEPENLYAEGYVLIGDPENKAIQLTEDGSGWELIKEGHEEPIPLGDDAWNSENFVSLAHMATSDDLDRVLEFVELIENFENADRKKDLEADQSIVELAFSIQNYGQLVPAMVRDNGDGTYTGIDGGRRICACLYLHALSQVLIQSGKTNPIFGEETPTGVVPAEIEVTERECSEDEIFVLSLETNLARKQFTPLQEGRVFHDLLQTTNPATGRKFSMTDAAKLCNVPYGTFRNRSALWIDAEYDENGKQIKGLTDGQRHKVATGQMLLTQASKKALGEDVKNDGKPVEQRQRALTLKAMQALYDETEPDNTVRLETLAECMGQTAKQAEKDSKARKSERVAKEEEEESEE